MRSALQPPSMGRKMDSKDVPDPVKAGLEKTFAAKDVDWDKEGDNYEASFKQKGNEMSVVLDASGNTVGDGSGNCKIRIAAGGSKKGLRRLQNRGSSKNYSKQCSLL